jgi:hypothetical protein
MAFVRVLPDQPAVGELAEQRQHVVLAPLASDVELLRHRGHDLRYPSGLGEQRPHPRTDGVEAIVHAVLEAEDDGFVAERGVNLLVGGDDARLEGEGHGRARC